MPCHTGAANRYPVAMDPIALSVFAFALFLGSYVQSVTGFAMGMIAIAILGGVNLVSIGVVTAAVSLLSLLNAVLALRGQVRHIRWRFYALLAAGQIPAIGAGVWLQTTLGRDALWLLELLLGAFIVLGSLSMMLRPEPRGTPSGRLACLAAGAAGGLVGGMFSASGPVMGWFNYRQPFGLLQIRATLLGCFVVTTSVRTIVVGAAGDLTRDVWWLTAFGVPAVVIGTWLGRNYPPALGDAVLRRTAFGVLLLTGAWVVARALSRLV